MKKMLPAIAITLFWVPVIAIMIFWEDLFLWVAGIIVGFCVLSYIVYGIGLWVGALRKGARIRRARRKKGNPSPTKPDPRAVRKPQSNDKYWKYRSLWADFPSSGGESMHTYCSVTFGNSNKRYYYRAPETEVKVGDSVYVPVGESCETKVGRVVAVETFCASRVPYPPERTKCIFGKVEEAPPEINGLNTRG